MGCCDDCYDEESSELNDKSKIKRRKIIKTIYFSLLFLYCLI